jgi:hypothetical protein
MENCEHDAKTWFYVVTCQTICQFFLVWETFELLA